MRITYESLELLSEQYGIDIIEALELLGDPLEDENGEYWYFPDANNDGIPDILAGLVTDPIITDTSVGGVIG